MATKQICDVKSCEQIIKDKAFTITLGNKLYDLCAKCYEGFTRFLAENLNPGHNSSITTKQYDVVPAASGYLHPLYGLGTTTHIFGGIQINPQVKTFGELTWSDTTNITSIADTTIKLG